MRATTAHFGALNVDHVALARHSSSQADFVIPRSIMPRLICRRLDLLASMSCLSSAHHCSECHAGGGPLLVGWIRLSAHAAVEALCSACLLRVSRDRLRPIRPFHASHILLVFATLILGPWLCRLHSILFGFLLELFFDLLHSVNLVHLG